MLKLCRAPVTAQGAWLARALICQPDNAMMASIRIASQRKKKNRRIGKSLGSGSIVVSHARCGLAGAVAVTFLPLRFREATLFSQSGSGMARVRGAA